MMTSTHLLATNHAFDRLENVFLSQRDSKLTRNKLSVLNISATVHLA